MSKKLFLIMVLIYLFITPFSVANQNIRILVNKTEIYSDVEPFISNDTTYVPLRFISQALKTDNISWDENTKCVTIQKDSNRLQFFINKNYAFINNVRKTINGTPLIKNNRTFVPLRIISENLDATVNWNSTTNIIEISTKSNNNSTGNTTTSKPSSNSSTIAKPSTSPNNNSSSKPTDDTITSYDKDAIYWLSRIIESEAAGEPYKGKVAVGEVILNRVESKDFPNTIWKVIFDDNFGIQFEPVANGTIYNVPSEESIKAAKDALNGSNYVGNSLYFLNPRTAQSNWITQNRQFCITIANHDFYL